MTPTSSAESGAQQRGFTLLELLVVLSIIALGVGLIAPNVGLSDNSAFSADVREAAATLSYARRLAIVRASPVTAWLSTGEDADVEDGTSSEQLRRRWTSDIVELRYQDDLQIEPQRIDRLSITFYPQGGSTGGTLHFSRDRRSAIIVVSPITGRIRLGWDGEDPADES
jgi:general secretion pathway protein H